MAHKKGDLYRFKLSLQTEKEAPDNIFSLISHFIDEEDKQEKLVLRDSGTLDALIAPAADMEKVAEATFEDKVLSCLTDMGESLRILAQTSMVEAVFEDDPNIEVDEEETPKTKKKNVH